MNFNKKKVTLNIDNAQHNALIIALPASPINVQDEFLQNYYRKSKNPNTPTNIRNRWKHSVETIYRIKRYLDGECKMQILFNYFQERKDEKVKSDVKYLDEVINSYEKSDIKVETTDIVSFPEFKKEFIFILITKRGVKISLKNKSILFELCKAFEL